MIQMERIFELENKYKIQLALFWDVFSIVSAFVIANWIRVGVSYWKFETVDDFILIGNLA